MDDRTVVYLDDICVNAGRAQFHLCIGAGTRTDLDVVTSDPDAIAAALAAVLQRAVANTCE